VVSRGIQNTVLRQLRRHVPGLSKLERTTRRYTGKSLSNMKMPSGFKPPRGMRLVNPQALRSTETGDSTGPSESAVEPELIDPDAPKDSSKKLLVILGVVVALLALAILALVAVPRLLDWWDERGADEVTPSTTVATTIAPTTTVVTTTTTPPTTTIAAIEITTWAVGGCASTGADGLLTPSTCDSADYSIASEAEHPADELTATEIEEAQTILADLGVDITIDGVLAEQTRNALDSATLGAGIPIDVVDRVKLAVIRSTALAGSLDDDGPRVPRTSPEICGAGVTWVETPSEVLCLDPR